MLYVCTYIDVPSMDGKHLKKMISLLIGMPLMEMECRDHYWSHWRVYIVHTYTYMYMYIWCWECPLLEVLMCNDSANMQRKLPIVVAYGP